MTVGYNPNISTAAAAGFLLGLSFSPSIAAPRPSSSYLERECTAGWGTTVNPAFVLARTSTVAEASSIVAVCEIDYASERPTTARERLIAEIRRYALMKENWDTEGAAAPHSKSVQDAATFACLLGSDAMIPEAMIHHSGRAGLFWHDDDTYADLEFLEDGRVAYYIERQGEKHKGVAKFNSQEVPAVFQALLEV